MDQPPGTPYSSYGRLGRGSLLSITLSHGNIHANSNCLSYVHNSIPGAHEPPKAVKERLTPVPCKYKFVP